MEESTERWLRIVTSAALVAGLVPLWLSKMPPSISGREVGSELLAPAARSGPGEVAGETSG